MDDSMRAEYPAMLANLTPSQAVQTLTDRVKRISKLNLEIADWLQERRKVEEVYIQALRKLAQFRVPNAQSELGTFQVQWDKIVQSTEAMAMSHHMFATKVEKDVEMPLRGFHHKKEMQNVQTIQGNLQNMAKELEEAQKKSDALNRKAGKASAAKVDQAASKLESASSQWESQTPFVFESLQALDETRMNQLRDALTQYGTYEGELAQQRQTEAEGVLNSLLDYKTSNEINYFVQRTIAGRPKLEQRGSSMRQSSSFGGASSSLAPPPNMDLHPPPTSQSHDDDRSERSFQREEKGEPHKLRSRIGTMLGRRRQSVHGGFGQLSQAKGPFRSVKSAHGTSPRGSMTNLGEGNSRLSSLVEQPDATQETSGLPEGHLQANHEGVNGVEVPDHVSGAQVNGLSAATAAEIASVPAPPGPPPTKEPEKDAQGFSIPSATLDPITAAQREAAAESEPAFKVDIKNEPVAEEDPEERKAALSNLSNTLSALGAPTRRTGTVRGRRDVRSTIYVPTPLDNPFPPSPIPPSTPSRPSNVAALGSEPSITGTSDTQSIRSSNSLSSMMHFKHPDMHEPGLNSSVMETVSASFESGAAKSVKVNGEIAFSFNDLSSQSSDHQTIRINNFSNLDVIGPNRIFIHGTPDHPDHFNLDLSHLRHSQPTVGFSYRLHMDDDAPPPVDHVPLLLHPVWKSQGDKLGLLLQYKLNPAFKFVAGSESLTLHHVVIFTTYEGKASGAQTKPAGTHLKDKHLVYWRLGDLALTPGQDWQRIICRIVGEQGVEPKPGAVEARWEFNLPAGSEPADAIGVSRLEEGKGKEPELNDEDPFADVGPTDVITAEGKWVDVPAVRSLISGKFEAK